MAHRTLILALLALAGGAADTASPARAADTAIATVDRGTPLSAYGSGLLFSKRDPATGRFGLWYAQTGRPPAALPVAERRVPFDADLGPGAHGHLLAVYSRCAVEPRFPSGAAGLPAYRTGRGCDLFELDLATGHERRLPASSPAASEVLPTVWRDRVAFARIDAAGPRLYVRARTGSAPARRLQGGRRTGASSGPTGLDLYGASLAVAWTSAGRYEGPASEIFRDDVAGRGRRQRIDTFAGGGLTTILLASPAFEAGRLYWGRFCLGDPAGCGADRIGLRRTRFATGGIERAPLTRRDLAQARGGGVTYVLRDSNGFGACHDPEASAPTATCTIVATAPAYR